ncbi:MAG: formyltransferase family protein [Telluria sp.]
MRAVFERFDDQLVRTEEPTAAIRALLDDADFIVSYGYRHLIPADVLAAFGSRAVNLHISLLPWNRGADPNLWSFLEDTPKGVTIHVLERGIDTGPILAQLAVASDPHDTLKTSYERLAQAMVALFADTWGDIRSGRLPARAQSGAGTYHRTSDRSHVADLLTQGWDTPVAGLTGKALHTIGERKQ